MHILIEPPEDMTKKGGGGENESITQEGGKIKGREKGYDGPVTPSGRRSLYGKGKRKKRETLSYFFPEEGGGVAGGASGDLSASLGVNLPKEKKKKKGRGLDRS